MAQSAIPNAEIMISPKIMLIPFRLEAVDVRFSLGPDTVGTESLNRANIVAVQVDRGAEDFHAVLTLLSDSHRVHSF